jgi:hypothetical protein
MEIAGTYRFYDRLNARSALAAPVQVDRFLASAQLSDTATQLRRLDEQIAKALEALQLQRSGRRTGNVSSTQALGLGTLATASRLSSTEAVNTDAPTTSYSPPDPGWGGGSTPTLAVTGTYAGVADDTLTFTVTQVGLLGLIPNEVTVTDGNGQTVATLTMDDGGSAHDLGNGLTVTFGAGGFEFGDSFTVDVFGPSAPTFDPTAAFDGSGGTPPGFDAGFAVVDGSFTVNGVTIAVAGTDSLQNVLQRINDSEAGVTAAYDAGTNRVTLTATSTGDEPIALADDTSGLLAALKLGGAVVTPGAGAEVDRTLAGIGAFAGVTNGALTVNGATVLVDKNADTIADIVDRINAQTTAQAYWDRNSQRIVLRAGSPGGTLTVADATGFLSVAGIANGTYEGTPGVAKLSQQAADNVAGALSAVAERLAGLDAANAGDYRSTAMATLRAQYKRISSDFSSAGYDAMLAGLALKAGTDAGSFGLQGGMDAATRARLLHESQRDAVELLRGEVSVADDGYLDRLRSLLSTTVSALDEEATELLR